MPAKRTASGRSATRGKSVAAPRQTPRSPTNLGPHEEDMADVIARRLEEDIVLGRRHPRERLIEQDLCEQFNTHRADVRLAFLELEKKGIIQRIPNRGAIVRDLTPNEVTSIYADRGGWGGGEVGFCPSPVVG